MDYNSFPNLMTCWYFVLATHSKVLYALVVDDGSFIPMNLYKVVLGMAVLYNLFGSVGHPIFGYHPFLLRPIKINFFQD